MNLPDSPVLGRRRFLTFLVAAPTLTLAARLGVDLLDGPAAHAQETGSDVGNGTYVLRVTETNRIVFESPKPDIGQGISTALAMLIAEELDAKLTDVDVPLADAQNLSGQSVGGSNSMRSMWGPARDLAAQARARLVTAAAQRWQLDASTLSTRDTAVWAPDGRSASFGSLSADAAQIATPAVSATPKPASQYRVIGTPTGQLEARDLVTGTTKFALDVAVPGALPTVVARPPTIEGTVVSFDASGALALPDVIAVKKIPAGVAVVARTFFDAFKGRDALRVTWGPGPADSISDATVHERLDQAIPPMPAPPLLSQHIDGDFEWSFVSHAPMETLNAVADVRDGSAEIWCSNESPNGVKSAVAKATGLAESAVTVHITRGGGAFGRRLYPEAPVEAAQISQAAGRPVRLMWSRNDDMRHGRMRPASHHRIRVAYAAGQVLSFTNFSSSVETDFGLTPLKDLVDPGYGGLPTFGAAYFQLTQTMPYDVGTFSTSLTEVPIDVPTGAWRSVYSGTNRASEEIMIDLLAKKLGTDALDFRIAKAKTAAAKALLQRLKTASGWGKAMPAGWAQGVGYQEEYGSRLGCVVDINATDPANARVTKAVLVADVGRAVNPTGLRAQFMGSVMDGISTVLRAGNHIDDGRVREGSYGDFLWARQKHAPLQFEAHFMPDTDAVGGAGELAVPAAAAAVANAHAKATGRPSWRFPISF